MRVRLDYHHHGGHKTRCEALELALLEAGHTINGREPDVHVWDFPAYGHPPYWEAPTRIIMGRFPVDDEWSWHPLGEQGDRTATGKEYLILDGGLGKYKSPTKWGTVLTMGSTDTAHNTENAMSSIPSVPLTVVVGPHFHRQIIPWSPLHVVVQLDRRAYLTLLGRSEFVICGWGQTTFEALYLGCKVLSIPSQFEHELEAKRCGTTIYRINETMGRYTRAVTEWHTDDTLDLGGAARTVKWIESCFAKQN